MSRNYRIVKTRVRLAPVVTEEGETQTRFIVEAFVVERGSAGWWFAFANRDGARLFEGQDEADAFERLMRRRWGLETKEAA